MCTVSRAWPSVSAEQEMLRTSLNLARQVDCKKKKAQMSQRPSRVESRVKELKLTVEFSFRWLMPSGLMTKSIVKLQPCCEETRKKLWKPANNLNQSSICQNTYHQPTGKAFLCVAVALSQGGEELDHALMLVQSRIALEGLLDQPAQLLGLKQRRWIWISPLAELLFAFLPSCCWWALWEKTDPGPHPS